MLWKLVSRWVLFLKGLSVRLCGSLRSTTPRCLRGPHEAEHKILRRLWDHAKVCREGRRREPSVAESGGQSAAVRVVKGAVAEDGKAPLPRVQRGKRVFVRRDRSLTHKPPMSMGGVEIDAHRGYQHLFMLGASVERVSETDCRFVSSLSGVPLQRRAAEFSRICFRMAHVLF